MLKYLDIIEIYKELFGVGFMLAILIEHVTIYLWQIIPSGRGLSCFFFEFDCNGMD